MALTKYIIFMLGEQKYSMRLSKINGIEQLYNVVPVPVGAPFIKGIIHLRNEIIPIYDLKERFRIEGEPEICNKQLLVSETHNMKLAFEVDDMVGIYAIEDEDVKSVPPVVKSEETGYLESVIKVDFPDTNTSEIIICVSVDKLMSENEFANVSEALEQTNLE